MNSLTDWKTELASARAASLGLVLTLALAHAAAAQSGGFAYRGACPTPMTLVDTEAYFCRTMGYKDLGKRVEAAYQAQVANLKTMYDEPANAEKLKHELDILEASQKNWERYAANECAAEGYMAWGGTLEPKLVGDCAQRLAEARIKELEMLFDGLGN